MIVAHSDLSGAMVFCKTGLYWFLYSSSLAMPAVIRIVTAEHCKLLRNRLMALRNERSEVRTAALKIKSSAMLRRIDSSTVTGLVLSHTTNFSPLHFLPFID
jgi:hypothetical protein